MMAIVTGRAKHRPTFFSPGTGNLTVAQAASATDFKNLLHVSDTNCSQTENCHQLLHFLVVFSLDIRDLPLLPRFEPGQGNTPKIPLLRLCLEAAFPGGNRLAVGQVVG